MTVTVKALEWSHFDNGNAYAGSIITTYFAHTDGTWCRRNGNFIQAGHNLEDAKAGAQADYDLRILSALISSPGKDGGQEVGAVAEWTYQIQYGPEGEADYAWVYRAQEMVATMKTHHARALCSALSAPQPASTALVERLVSKISSISDDFVPDRDADAPLALQEMRDALKEAIAAASSSGGVR